jgi:hypothetical protein
MHVYLFDEPIPVAGFISINGLLFRETSSNHFEIERASKSSPISLEICEESILIQSKLKISNYTQLSSSPKQPVSINFLGKVGRRFGSQDLLLSR